MAIKAEYIWIDGTEPTPQLRSKTKVISDDSGTDLADMPIWGFDGSSTNQATGDKSDCVLKPARVFPDPIRGGENVLVMCEVMLVDGKAHPTNTRAAAARTAKKYKKHEPMFGIEQEYTMLKPNGNPLGFPDDGFPAPQGPYYCGVGEIAITGRNIAEDHMDACLAAGVTISGINAEVMPGQWEFQVGPIGL
ncbi:MAG: glutamine synthetase, partial [Ilumatobacter sp.]|nr:glutamine synthetase [Ilumatobacter sp.]